MKVMISKAADRAKQYVAIQSHQYVSDEYSAITLSSTTDWLHTYVPTH